MSHLKLFAGIAIVVVDLLFNCALAKAAPATEKEAEVVEVKLYDPAGLKLEIFKRQKQKKKPHVPPKNPPPDFPDDLIISDDIKEKQKLWFPWIPLGTNNRAVENDCRQESVRDRIWRNTSVPLQAEALNNWVNKCYDKVARGFLRSTYIPLIRFATVDYDLLDSRNIHHVRATLSDGRVLDGFIAMKPGDTPRPFVIAKCGVLCNADQSVMHRSFMMHLYDESPFHVLTLANNTGSEFMVNNKALSVGGFDEGRQLYQIAQLVKSVDSPVHHRISSVHVVGASLGGSAALYAGLYSSQNDPRGQESIQSVTAICPVVVLDHSIRDIYSSKPISTVAVFETLHQIRDVFNFVPVIGRFFPLKNQRMRAGEIYDKLTQAILSYYREWTVKSSWDLKPFTGVRVQSLDHFWELNDYRNYVDKVTIPTLTISSDNDELVKTPANSKLLAKKLHESPNDKVGTVFLHQGNHCAFAIGNGWGNYSMILREYILSHSPEADKHWHKTDREFGNVSWKLKNDEQVVDALWEAQPNDDKMNLKVKIFSPSQNFTRGDCDRGDPSEAGPHCYRTVVHRMPIRTLPLEDLGTPLSEYEATSLTRLANTRFSLVDEKGELVINHFRKPHAVRAWVWK
ncbi:hypothetical protein [Bdellovibrio sp. HCB337]|uniref:hypothetical protein n=1 Tax=Bdellovibrio sp. HCB337 TaxID=3394358 RepID=UPI0039A4F890